MKKCIACGMPMLKAEDFPQKDESKDYCIHCARPDGSMQSYEEKLEGMAGFLVKTQGLEKSAAYSAAVHLLAKLPAWQGRTE
jgi:hypothetical protein